MKSIRKIAIVGPESTGKSALASALSKKLGGCLVIEMARNFLNEINRPYKEEDLLTIAHLQIAEEDKMLLEAECKLLICDTNLLVLKIWSLHKYNRCHPWIEEQLQARKYDLHLLCNIDLPWQDDPLREHPHMRQYFFNWYHKEMMEGKVNYELISGYEEKRFLNAMKLIPQQWIDSSG